MSTPIPPAESGRRGADRRWGPKRRLNIGDLSPAQRTVVLGLIEAQRLANAARKEAVAVSDDASDGPVEVRRARVERPTPV